MDTSEINMGKVIQDIPLDSIRIIEGMQNKVQVGHTKPDSSRFQRSEKIALRELIGDMNARKQQTPIIVYKLSKEHEGMYGLIEGHHRLEAAKKLGWKTLKAEALTCSDDEAWLQGRTSNLSSTRTLTRDQRVENMWVCLTNPSSGVVRAMNNSQCARSFGVGRPTIIKMRKEIKEYQEEFEIGNTVEGWQTIRCEVPQWKGRKYSGGKIDPEKLAELTKKKLIRYVMTVLTEGQRLDQLSITELRLRKEVIEQFNEELSEAISTLEEDVRENEDF
ncbi:MAG: ParB/RepB/Spo0J family partition protein [Desulfoplanes sp.]